MRSWNLKKVAKASKDKKVGDDPYEGTSSADRLYARWLFSDRYEKKFPTYIEETAQIFDKISISAGQRGVQVILNPEELAKYVDAQFVALIQEW